MSADVTEEIKQMTEDLVHRGMYKSQSEVVRDAIRQSALKYSRDSVDITSMRKKISLAGKRSHKTLSATVRELRDDS
jgi:putative addiction module CopG family antidote